MRCNVENNNKKEFFLTDYAHVKHRKCRRRLFAMETQRARSILNTAILTTKNAKVHQGIRRKAAFEPFHPAEHEAREVFSMGSK